MSTRGRGAAGPNGEHSASTTRILLSQLQYPSSSVQWLVRAAILWCHPRMLSLNWLISGAPPIGTIMNKQPFMGRLISKKQFLFRQTMALYTRRYRIMYKKG